MLRGIPVFLGVASNTQLVTSHLADHEYSDTVIWSYQKVFSIFWVVASAHPDNGILGDATDGLFDIYVHFPGLPEIGWARHFSPCSLVLGWLEP